MIVEFLRNSGSEDLFRVGTPWGYGEFQMIDVLPNVRELQNATAVENNIRTAIVDYAAVWEFVVALSTVGAAEATFVYVGGGHGFVSRTSRTITVDGVDYTSVGAGVPIAGSSIVHTQLFNMLLPSDGVTIVGTYLLKHTFTSAGCLVNWQLAPVLGLYEWYVMRTALFPLGTVNQIQFEGRAVQAITNAGSHVDFNKGSHVSLFRATDTRHPYGMQISLPSGGPSSTGSWANSGADGAWWVDQIGGAKLYVNNIGLAYGDRLAALPVMGSTLYQFTRSGALWLNSANQSEVWSASNTTVRAFDPAIFENNPIFDTGPTAGIWANRSKQAEIWSARIDPTHPVHIFDPAIFENAPVFDTGLA